MSNSGVARGEVKLRDDLGVVAHFVAHANHLIRPLVMLSIHQEPSFSQLIGLLPAPRGFKKGRTVHQLPR